MNEPKWLSRTALELLHAESLATFGGAEGMRDSGLFESALARPQHRFHYEPDSRLAGLAASYAFGLTKNHPFVDGNKRMAFLAILLFLEINGQRLSFDKIDAIKLMLSLAAGEVTEEELAVWISAQIRAKVVSLPSPA